MQTHTKIGRKLWARTSAQWVRDQGADHVDLFWILQQGRVMEGFVNKRTGKRIISALRRATPVDYAREATRKFAKKAKNIFLPMQ